MDPMPSYNLLQAVDPTKIKVPISERFAKLTLSSNKKQQEKCDKLNQQEELKNRQEKRVSVSRNISKQFEDEVKEKKFQQNPVLRSESSEESECNNSADEDPKDFTMEPLEVSKDFDNPTDVEDCLELLSQQIASLTVEPKPASVSSGSTCSFSVNTALFSNESQSSRSSDVNNVHIVHNIPINIEEALKRDSIPLNLTSSKIEKLNKSNEIMTEDDDEEEEENEVITISDTSESNPDQRTMSISRVSSSSENLRLPSHIDDKAERVAAFLRDVSVERRIMVEEGHINFTDTIDRILNNEEIDKIQETIAKSRQIATADTESMTPDVDEVVPKSLEEREERLKALEQSENEATNVHGRDDNDSLNKTVLTDSEQQHDVEKTPKNPTNNMPFKDVSPMNAKGRMKDIYRIANDDTQCNSEHSMVEKTPKIQQNTSDSRRLPNRDTEDNSKFSSPEEHLSRNKNNRNDSRRLVNEDTISNSISDVGEPGISNRVQDYKTPEKGGKTHTNDETKSDSVISLLSPSQSPADSDHYQEALDSIINSSTEINATVPEDSVTILDTDDENSEQHSTSKEENSENKKLSNSFHGEDSSTDSESDSQISKIQMAMDNINISAKINIKIHIPNIVFTHTNNDDENYKPSSQEGESKRKDSNQLNKMETENSENKTSTGNNHSDGSNEQIVQSDQSEKHYNQIREKCPVEEIASSSNKSPSSSKDDEDEKFVAEAEKLLNQLYGKTWQTPDVIRTLKHTGQSGEQKKTHNTKSSRKKNSIENSSEKKSNNKTAVEESILDDFSIFRRDIVKTNLDSTRLRTPSVMQSNKVLSEPRNFKKSSGLKKKLVEDKLMPQTPLSPVEKDPRNRRRINNNRWRRIIDDLNNSDGDNASDDSDADRSWSRNASALELEDSGSDFESPSISKTRNTKKGATKRQFCSEKSIYLTKKLNNSKDGEIIYLDLSKEEVEVQDEVPESPPANHDATFASRLKDILKTCLHEDKPKLPSSNKKTKRKLFTPNFGDDDFEASLPIEDERTTKENVTKTNNRNYDDEEILEDRGICPFDSQGRVKILSVVNKQLESVKTGKPIFQLTPTPKKKGITSSSIDRNVKSGNGNTRTPAKNSDKNAIFKTPITVKSRGAAKTSEELLKTPDYKYSFLKSLDVTVSKTLCHPDALYYRDSYSTKKEELSKILYNIYNEKLFRNKLDVPITWNKKLLNTAGRCCNKKKLGIRLSTIELSNKVLTSADRLRCTLLHELCHAATWIFSGEGGHGKTWKEWACRANMTFPEIPKIGVCHQYDIEYKYTYKCNLCGAKSYAHSKSKKVQNIRCSYCHGAIEVFLNKKDKDGNVIPTPVKEPTGFAKFVRDNYKKFQRDDLKHTDVMKLLSSQFAALKVAPIEN